MYKRQVPVFPVAAVGADLADVDLGIEVCRERIAMVSPVAVEDIDIVDLVKFMLQRVRGKNARHARIEAAAEQRRDARLFEALAVGPLPLVFELRGIQRLIVGGVDIVCLRRQARVQMCIRDRL